MISRITKEASILGVLEYNAEKVLSSEASVLYGNMVLGDGGRNGAFDIRLALSSFQPCFDAGSGIPRIAP